jgi:hypothetical protein
MYTRVDSMMEKFDTRDRKSSARGRTCQCHQTTGDLSYGLLFGTNFGWSVTCVKPLVLFELAVGGITLRAMMVGRTKRRFYESMYSKI